MIYDTIPHTLHLDLHRQECRAVSALRWLESYQQTGYQEFLERALNELKAAEETFEANYKFEAPNPQAVTARDQQDLEPRKVMQ